MEKSTKVIIIEIRRAAKKEARVFGTTDTVYNTSKIFIDSNQSAEEFTNTYFHEVTHAFLHWFAPRIQHSKQEELSRIVGNIVAPLFRKYKKRIKK